MQRRKPTQARGKRRVEAILNAAAIEFAEVGFDQTTMDAIAQRANSSIGSVYQFFPNKQAIFAAIAEGCIERSRVMFETFITPEVLAQGWEKVVHASLDGYFEFERKDSWVRAMYANLHLYGTYAGSDVAMLEDLMEQTAVVMGAYAPHLKPAKRKLIAQTMVQVTTAFLFMTRIQPEKVARKGLEETKILMSRYLEPYLEAE